MSFSMGGLWGRIKANFKASEPPPYPNTLPGSSSGVWHLGPWDSGTPQTRLDYRAEVYPAWQNAVVSLGLSWLSDNFSEPPLEVVRDVNGEETPQEENPLLALLAQPNAYCDRAALWGATVLSYVVAGNAYWLKIRDGGGQVTALWWAPHWCIRPGHNPETFSVSTAPPEGYLYRVGAEQVWYPREDVVHFRNGLDPNCPYLGLSQLDGIWKEIYTDNAAASFEAAILRNHGTPSVILSPTSTGSLPLTLGPDERDALKRSWVRETTGDKSGGPIVASNALEVTPLNHSPEEMALDVLRRYSESRICSALGLPPMVLGLWTGLEHSTFANMQEAQKAAYVNALIPMQARFAEVVTGQLLIPDGFGMIGDRVRFDYSAVPALSEGQDEIANRAVLLVKNRVITRNEGREMLGLDPMAGGDELDPIPQPMGFGGQNSQDQTPPPPSQRSYALHLRERRVEFERSLSNGNGRH